MDFDKINIGAVSYNVKDTTARKQIGDETTARKQADSQLSQQIGNVSTSVQEEANAREAADTALSQQIGDETAARKQADTQLSQQISQQFDNIGKTPYANVLAYGADPTGTNDSSTAFNEAKNSGNVIFVPYGTYNIQSFRPENCKIVIAPNVTLQNPPEKIPKGPEPTFLALSFEENVPSYAEFAITSYDDSTDEAPKAGWVKSAFRIDHHVQSTNDYFSWALCVVLDNATENVSTENVALYAQANAHHDTKTWGMVSEINDAVRNPNYGKVGMEITCKATGPDTINNRVGLDVAIHNSATTPGAEKVAWGYGVRVASDGPDAGNIASAFRVNGLEATRILDVDNVRVTGHAIDLSKADIRGTAIYLGAGQILALDNFLILKEPGQSRILFKLDNQIVGYVDGGGFHNGTP